MRSKPSFSANRGFDGAGGPGRFGPTAAAPGATTRRGTRLRTTVVGALLIVAAASAHLAAAPSGPNGAWQENGPRRLDRPAARELASRIGGAWHVETADGSGLPTVVYGTGLDLGRRLDDELAVLEEAFGFLDEHRDFFGLEEIDLDGTPVRAGSLWYLNLGLVRSGVPFDRRSRVDLRLRPEGVLAAVLTHRIPATIESSSPERAASDAARLAVSRTREEPSALDARAEGDPRLEYVVSPVDRTARLAWRVTVAGTRRNTYGTQPLRRDVWIAARGDLAVLDTLDLVHDVDVTGDVIGRGHPFDPRGPLAPIPLRELEVSITETGATTLTDAAGLFTLPNPGTDPVTVVAELRGSYVDVNTRDGGEDLRYEKVNTPGNPVAIRFHTAPDPGDPRQAAQVDGYVHTNIVRDYLRARLPLSGLDDPIDCNVNVTTSSCNAFYTGGTINFYTEGDNCVNMAFDTIVYHEYGHYLDDLAGGILDRALTEGLADVIAVYASGQPLVGENYRFGSDYLRTAENDRVWPANECGNRPHCIGESFSGFCWDARTELVRSLGDTEGVRVAEEIVLSSILGNAINIPRAVLEVFLQDDDDGNLANRTPHFRELGKAAVRHGFDPPTVEVIRFTHVERPFAVGDPINDLEIEFGMEAFAGPVANPTLLYSIDNASTFEEVPMQPGSEPGVFTASVPRQDVGAWIKYYARAEDALGNVRTAPTGAPGPVRRKTFSFHIGRAERIFFDDFEAGLGNWTHGADAGVDDWEAGPPNPAGTNPYDPLAAYSGTSVAGTDLSMDGNYENSSSTFLQTQMDASGQDEVWVRFRWFASVQTSPDDVIRFRVENSSVFINDQREGLTSFAWLPFDRDITLQARDNPELDLKFTLESDEAATFGGWNVDDFELLALRDDLVTLELDRREVRPGEPVTVTVIGGADEPYWVLSDHRFGDATFQIPGGPLLATGLTENQRLRAQANLDSEGRREVTRSFPSNPALIGKHYVLVALSRSGVWQRSNFFEFDVVP